MRFGISTIDGILPKSLRLRRPHWIVPAMYSPKVGAVAPPSHRASIAARFRASLASRTSDRGPKSPGCLLHLHRRALLLELLLHVVGLGLRDLLLHGLRDRKSVV